MATLRSAGKDFQSPTAATQPPHGPWKSSPCACKFLAQPALLFPSRLTCPVASIADDAAIAEKGKKSLPPIKLALPFRGARIVDRGRDVAKVLRSGRCVCESEFRRCRAARVVVQRQDELCACIK